MLVSYGYACLDDLPHGGVDSLAKLADERMYAAKEEYCRASGHDRRNH